MSMHTVLLLTRNINASFALIFLQFCQVFLVYFLFLAATNRIHVTWVIFPHKGSNELLSNSGTGTCLKHHLVQLNQFRIIHSKAFLSISDFLADSELDSKPEGKGDYMQNFDVAYKLRVNKNLIFYSSL